MSFLQPQSSFASQDAPRSKVFSGKNKSPSGFWLRQRQVPVAHIRSSLGRGDDNDPAAVATTTMATTRRIMIPTIPLPHPLEVVTPPLLFLAPFVETIFIRPVLLPILSNQVVTEMLLVAVTTLM